jgi:hypothetical protein
VVVVELVSQAVVLAAQAVLVVAVQAHQTKVLELLALLTQAVVAAVRRVFLQVHWVVLVVQDWLYCLFRQTVTQAQLQVRQLLQHLAQTQSSSSTLQVLTRRKSWLLNFNSQTIYFHQLGLRHNALRHRQVCCAITQRQIRLSITMARRG